MVRIPKIVEKENTDIKGVVMQRGTSGHVYNLQGMHVGYDKKLQSLPAGVYIVKGKKMVVSNRGLFHIIHLHHDDAYRLVAGVICHLGDVPVSREEDEEVAGGTVEETGLPAVVVVVDYVGTILAVGVLE